MRPTEEFNALYKGIEPPSIARHFDEINALPRPSSAEWHVKRYVIEWAAVWGFEFNVDDAGNIAVHIPATPGHEHSPHVILQGHMDIFQSRTEDSEHNFEADPITMERTGDNIHSAGNKTTLGADNAMGVAMAMSIAEDPDAVHGPMTLLFTADEEQDMTGAFGIGEDMIPKDSAEYVLINLDSEDGAAFAANGSAGGADTVATLDISDDTERFADGAFLYTLKISGFKGGHSGIDIHRGHGNALMYLYSLLREIDTRIPTAQLVHISGGTGSGAIAEDALCTIAIPQTLQSRLEGIRSKIEQAAISMNGEHKNGIQISFVETKEEYAHATSSTVRSKILGALSSAIKHDGVIEATDIDFPLLSNNLGAINMDDTTVRVDMLARSAPSHMDRLDSVLREIHTSLTDAGFVLDPVSDNRYRGWQEPEQSRAVEVARSAYTEVFGGELTVRQYHAAAEAQFVKNRIAEITDKPVSAVMIGPKIEGAHTTREQVLVPSVTESYRLLKEMLKQLAA